MSKINLSPDEIPRDPHSAAAQMAAALTPEPGDSLPGEWFSVVLDHLRMGDPRSAKLVGVQMAQRWKTVDALIQAGWGHRTELNWPVKIRQEMYELLLSDPRRAVKHAERWVEGEDRRLARALESRRAVQAADAANAQRRSDAFKAARRRRNATVSPIRRARPTWQRSGKVPPRVLNAMDPPRARGQLTPSPPTIAELISHGYIS